jgi:cobalt/nickel transport system permease protein
MHIPDGFLNNGAAGSLMAAAIGAVSLALGKVKSAFLEKVPVLKRKLATFPNFDAGSAVSLRSRLSKTGQEKLWRMAKMVMLIFSFQLLDFPTGLGASGHLLGGFLAAAIVGPFEALLAVSAVIGVQAFALGDGGALALGANIFNMGIVGALGGWAYFKFLNKGKQENRKMFLKNIFVAAWLSVIFAAGAFSLEAIFFAGKPLGEILSKLLLTHIAVGLVEGIATVAILAYMLKNKHKIEIFDWENPSVDDID